ncbi:hypothetical protein ElyMa_004660400, partial [Elysia marginata]
MNDHERMEEEDTQATKILSKHISDLNTRSPDALHIVNDDFNHVPRALAGFKLYQHVTCHTRNNKTLDLCIQLAPLGNSDHHLVLLRPRYTPLARREPPVKKTVLVWTADAWETLRASLECTDWSVFVNSSQDMSELADTVCCYINFCIETAIPTKTIKVYSNNKPWVTKDIKQILNRKKIAFQNKRDIDIKSIHKEVRATIRQGKESYRRKIEKYFKNNDMRKVWQGMNLMGGCKGKKGNNCVEGDEGYANDLNKYYARFDHDDFVQEREECKNALFESILHNREIIVINESAVRKAMLALKPNKAAGPDGVKPSVLKKCVMQLSSIMCEIFNMSFKGFKVPK